MLYLLTDTGMLSAFDAKTGKPHYQQQRLPKPYQFKASPVGANGKLYLASENDDVIVVKMGPTFEVLATNTLEDQTFIATPAIADGELYLRGRETRCLRSAERGTRAVRASRVLGSQFGSASRFADVFR